MVNNSACVGVPEEIPVQVLEFVVGVIVIGGGVLYACAYSAAHPNCHHPRYCQRRGRPRGM